MYWTNSPCQYVGAVQPAQLTITSYIQIDIGYNCFFEEPLCDQPNHTPCSTARNHNIIMTQRGTSEHIATVS